MSFTPTPPLPTLGERIRQAMLAGMAAAWPGVFDPGAGSDTGHKNIAEIARGVGSGALSALYGWDDVRVPLLVAKTGPTIPDFVDFRGGLLQWRLAHTGGAEYLYFSCQLPHGYKPGSDLYPHVHYSLGANHAANTGAVVQFDLLVSASSVNNAFPAAQTVVMTDTIAGPDYQHQVAFSASPLSGAGLTESAMLLCRLTRNNSGGSNPLVGAFALEFDFHIEMEKSGTDNPFPPYTSP